MSRIGKKPIEIPDGVDVRIEKQNIKIKGPKGELSREVLSNIAIKIKEGKIIVSPKKDDKSSKPFWGLERALIQNMIDGVHTGFQKRLELVGIGYRARMEDGDLLLELGFSHPVKVQTPKDIHISVKGKIITIEGINKAKVGITAANIKKIRKPDPYKGKGVRYLGEEIRLKPGKKAATGT